MRWILIAMIVIAPLSMSFNFFKSQPRDYAEIAREIRGKIGKKLAKKHFMGVVGVSGGMMGSVYMIGLIFQVKHPMDRNEARCRLVDCVEELMHAVNENLEIRPFLKDCPFTTKNVKITIFINDQGKPIFDPDIMAVTLCESDEITFYTKEPNKIPYKNRIREPYQEALAILKSLQSK